jgi:hypothetical protein
MSATLIIYPLNDANQEVAYTLDCDEVDIALTLSVQDIQDITKRRGSFSKSITLPGTNANNQAFGYAYNIQSFVGGFTPNKRIRCALWDNGIQTFSGSLQLLSITKQSGRVTYDVVIFSEEIAFFRQINETLLINTAGVSGFDHNLSVSGVSGTWAATPGSGYVYGFLDGYGYTDVVPSALQFFGLSLLISYLSMVPSFYVKQLVDLIFAQAGYRYQSAFFNSTRFKRLVLPYAGGATIQQNLAGQLVEVESRSAIPETGEGVWTEAAAFTYTAVIPFDDILQDPFVYWDDTRFSFTNIGMYATWDCQYTLEVQNTSNTTPISFGVAFCDFTTGLPLNFPNIQSMITQTIGPNETRKYDFQGQINLAPNQEVQVRVYFINGELNPYTFAVLAGARLYMIGQEIPVDGAAVEMVKALPPDITQADLLADLQKMFNLYIYQAPQDPKLLYIEPFDDFYTSGSVDWTQKVDQQGEQVLTMGDPEMRKSITFKYKDSGDALGKLYSDRFADGYGSRIFKTDNYYAKGEEVIETKCATVLPASYNSGFVIGRTFDLDSNGLPKERATGYRIAQYNYIQLPSLVPWILLEEISTPKLTPIEKLPFISHIDDPYDPQFDLAFGMPKQLYYKAFTLTGLADYTDTNLFKTYWLRYIEETVSKESMQIELDVMLDPVDIYNLDFRKPIYIDGIKFRLLEVRDYVVGGNTKCRALLRRILNLSAPSTGAVTVSTQFDSSDLVLGEMKPQLIQPII